MNRRFATEWESGQPLKCHLQTKVGSLKYKYPTFNKSESQRSRGTKGLIHRKAGNVLLTFLNSQRFHNKTMTHGKESEI